MPCMRPPYGARIPSTHAPKDLRWGVRIYKLQAGLMMHISIERPLCGLSRLSIDQ